VEGQSLAGYTTPDAKRRNNKMDFLLTVKNLSKTFKVSSNQFFDFHPKKIKAVNNVSFSVLPGTTLGIVGETGCGKSTLGRTIVRLYEPTSGEIFFKGQNITNMRDAEFRPYRKKIQMIFQDPYLSLDARMTAGEIIAEPIKIHKILSIPAQIIQRECEIMDMVGLNKEHLNRYPHEFSGGQRQRIGLARAIAVGAELIICDEPVSALDVSIQAQIITLFESLQDKLKLTYIFISHDLAMVKHVSNTVAVMYLGKIVELSSTSDLFRNPLHPYTKLLISAVPVPDPKLEKNRYQTFNYSELVLENPYNNQCQFFDRCLEKRKECENREPMLREVSKEHFVSCFLSK
jgi:oligopeptide transport system ATP-binding protein